MGLTKFGEGLGELLGEYGKGLGKHWDALETLWVALGPLGGRSGDALRWDALGMLRRRAGTL